MLSSLSGWLLCVVCVLLVWVYLLISRGPAKALGVAIVLSLVCPTWIEADFAGMPFNVRTTIACVTMLVYAFHPKGKIVTPLTWLDFPIAILYVLQITSDSYNSGFSPYFSPLAYGEWALPYVAGRYAVRNYEDLRFLAPWVLGILAFLGIAAIFEAVSGVNPFEVVFGNRPEELAPRDAERFGLKRAFGPLTHPIYFGMFQVVLMPWLFCLWQKGESFQIRLLATMGALLALAGTVCTISRTPVMTCILSAGLLTVIRYRFLRWPFALSCAVAVGGFLMYPDKVIDTISDWTGRSERSRLIEVDGKAVVTSSTRTRLVLFKTYSNAMIKGGLTGYGSKAVSTFPPQIPYMQGKSAISEIKAVDNAYILLTLRFGWLGGASLLLLFMTSFITAAMIYSGRSDSLFVAAVASVLVCIATFSLLLVWFSSDFSLPILWTFGVLSGLTSADRRHRHSESLMYR